MKESLPGCYTFFLFMVLAVACPKILAEESKSQATPEALVELLEKGDFDERQDAIKQLEALGESARSALEKAQKASATLDVRETATRLLSNLVGGILVFELMDMSGRPVPGVQMSVTMQQNSAINVFASREEPKPVPLATDADGTAVMKGMVPGPAQISVEFKNYFATSLSTPGWAMYIKSGKNRIQYVVEKGGSVTGTVAGDDGKPLENAHVSLLADATQLPQDGDLDPVVNESAGLLRSDANAKGAFTIENVQPGTYQVVVQHEEHITKYAGVVDVRSGVETALPNPVAVSAKAKVLGSVKVKVLDEEGKPFINGKVAFDFQHIYSLTNPDELAASKRRLRANLWQGSHKAVQTSMTDASGFLEIKNQSPGDYRLILRREEGGAVVFPKVAVVAGQATTLDPKIPSAPSSITGRVVDSSNKAVTEGLEVFALGWENPETLVVLSDPRAFNNWFSNWEDENTAKAKMTGDKTPGSFEIKPLAPGKYSLCIWKNRNEQELLGVVHGIEVVEGKAVVVPDFVLPRPAGLKGKSQVSGTVVDPDGKPVENATLTLLAGSTQNTTRSSAGKFEFESVELVQPARLIAGLEGFRPVRIDLSEPGLNLKKISAKFEKQKYGSLWVTVTDPDGAALKGARVCPVPSAGVFWNRRNQAPASRTRQTGADGKVYLKGLAWGEREVRVEMDGFYLPNPVKVIVAADADTALTVKLQKGLACKGTIVVPAGVDRSRVLVYFQGTMSASEIDGAWFNSYNVSPQFFQSSGVSAQGRFEFTGLCPGKGLIIVQYPGYVLDHHGEVEISSQAPDLALTMLPAGGLKLDCGAAAHGTWTRIVPPDSWNLDRPEYDAGASDIYVGAADSRGTVENFGVKPGTYDLIVLKADDSGSDSEATTSVAAVYPKFTIPVIPDGRAGFDKQKFESLKPLEANATVAGRMAIKSRVIKHGANATQPEGTLTLTLAGGRTLANVSIGVDKLAGKDLQKAPLIIGTAPAVMPAAVPGEFLLTPLPPGEYALYWNFEPGYSNPNGTDQPPADPKEKIQKPQLIRKLTIAKNETVQLGEIAVELPDKAYTHKAETQPDWWRYYYGGEVGEDEDPIFRP